MRVLFLRALFFALFALTASAWAGPVSQDEGAPAPDDTASGVSGALRAQSGTDALDTGDAGKLARLVDEIARGPAASSVPAARSPSAKESRAAAAKEKDKDSEQGDGGLSERDGPRRPKWLGGEPDTTATTVVPPPVIREREANGGPAPGTIFDHASVEDRSRMRDIVFMLKEVVYHPITWVVVLVLIAASLVSAGRRR